MIVRALCVLLVLVAAMAVDVLQRTGPMPDPLAVWPIHAGGVGMTSLQGVSGGAIPTPRGARVAHASNLLAMAPGQSTVLTAFWFAGDHESAPNVRIAASQFDRLSQRWSPARFVVDRTLMAEQLGFGLRRLGNPVAWLDASGRIHLFVVATGFGGWAAGRVLHLVQSSATTDLATLEFVPERVLPLSWLWNISVLVRNNPLPLTDGGMVLPAYFELGIKFPVALRFDANGHFVSISRISRRSHLLQPTLVMRSPAHWLAFMRDSSANGHIGVAETLDGGQQWQDLPDLDLVNPDAAIQGIGLSQGVMALVHNSSPHSRSVLDLSTSVDGIHWTAQQTLAEGEDSDEYSYPGLAWADDDLWVSYTDHRSHIAWQRFSGQPVAGSYP